jgi:hypothetical protein
MAFDSVPGSGGALVARVLESIAPAKVAGRRNA